ncbi:hypothetical protein SteCoe_26055 [Stentor coeruleus]|uniref:Uncharacterized protein n=1 Tax=Stentor coeruleus TaxID=5963 RepID=A0A1R2BDU8_9CILI|nr:hypothetical protein SteCoe_26055 [Stentor coeruleus]
MEEQRKFKILKNKLEALNYKQTFSIDSIPLIEALLNDITSLNSSLSRLRLQKSDPEGIHELSERVEYLNREKLRLEQELQRGSIHTNPFEDLESLNKNITDLKRENKVLSQKLLSMQSTKRDTFDGKNNENINKLFADFNFLKQQLDETEESSQKYAYENRSLQDKIRILEGQIGSLKKELEISIFTIKDITSERKSATEEYYSLKKVITGYESKCSAYEEENNSLRNDLQKIQMYGRSLEQQLSVLNKDLSKNRNELEMNSSTKIRLSSQIESLQRQIDILQNENTKYASFRDDDRKLITELENKCKEFEEVYKASQDKIRVIQRESQNFCDTIREKSEEIKIKDQSRKGLEKELKDAKAFIIKYNESQEEISRLRIVVDDLNNEIRQFRDETRDLKSSVKYKEDDVKQYKGYLDQVNKDCDMLKRKLEEESMKVENLNVMIRSYTHTEEQLKFSKNQYEDSVLREKQLRKELEQFQMIVQKSEEKFKTAQKQQESLQSQVMLYEQENAKMQKNLSDLLAKDNAKTVEFGRYENRIRENYCEIEDLKRKIIELDKVNRALNDEIRERHKVYIAEQNHSSRQNEQFVQLKDYVSSLEIIRSELIKKLENFQASEIDKDSNLKRFRDEVTQIKKQLQISERNCNDGLIERERNLKEIDNLQYENSRRLDEISLLKSQIKRITGENDDLKSKNKSSQESEENYKRSWRDSEIEKARVTEINLSLNLQLEDSKKSCLKLQNQIQDMTKDLSYNENKIKALEEKQKALNYEKDNFAIKVDEIGKELRNEIEISANTFKDKDELSQKLRIISEEYDKLLRAYDFLNLDLKKLTTKTTAGENLIENLKKQEDIYVKTIKKLEEDIRNAIRAKEVAEFKRIDAEKTSENLIKDIHSAKSLTRDFDINRDDFHRKIVSIENEKSYLESRCRSLESEIGNLKSQLDYEKQKFLEQETRSFGNKDSFKRYELDDERTKSLKFSNSEQLISDLYKQIEIYKAESVKLEMNYMKLLDELNQTKHMLNRAEARVTELEIIRR